MQVSPVYPLRIFFDGSCSVCAEEMTAYRRREHDGRLEFIDISAPGFDPTQYGLILSAFMYELHAIDRENHIYRGVDAFAAIWRAFPQSTWYGFLGVLISFPGIHLLARLNYRAFARLRKFLPKHRVVCKG